MTIVRKLGLELWIVLAAMAVLAIIALLDYRSQTRAINAYDSYSSYDYQPGGYRAWYELLQREGFNVVHYRHRLAYINDAVTTLIVANNQYDAALRTSAGEQAGVFQAAELNALGRWVRNGGHLIWLSDGTPIDDQDNALHLPGFIDSPLHKDAAIPVVASALVAGVHKVSGDNRLRVDFQTAHPALPIIADDTGAVVALYRLGKGTVTVVSDESLFRNGTLQRADNAQLAYNLAATTTENDPAGVIAFEEWSHGYQSGDTWWGILPRPLQWACVVFCSAVVLALIGSTIRFGPAVRLPDSSERTSQEYVNSMAGLLRRGHASRTAVRDLAQLAHHEIAQAFGLPDSISGPALAARCRGSDRGAVAADALLTLDRLAGYEQPTTAELLRAAQLCYTLRKEYGTHGDWRRVTGAFPRRRTA